MFYPELQNLYEDSHKILSEELISEIDSWLALLPDEYSDKITVTKFSAKFNIEYNISRSILEKLCELKILERLYAILCPECSHVLKITTTENLLQEIEKINYCYGCNEEDIEITADNIEVRYKLIKKPDDPKKIKSFYEKISGKQYISEQDSIKALIEKDKSVTNDIFYTPTEDDYNKLKSLFRGLTDESKTSTETGNRLEVLILELLKLIRGFSVTTKAKTSTNQIDCYVINNSPIPNSVINKMGHTFICECKNENKVPKNDYFHKIANILIQFQSNNTENKFGIIFSRKKAPSTYKMMAYKTYIISKVTIIYFNSNELEDIIIKRVNLLDYIDYKINVIQQDLVENDEIKRLYNII